MCESGAELSVDVVDKNTIEVTCEVKIEYVSAVTYFLLEFAPSI